MSGVVHAEKLHDDKRKLIEIAAPVARTPALTVGHAFDPAEAEADRVADSVIAKLRSGQEGGEHEHTGGCDHGVQRSSAPAAGAEVGMAGGELSAGLTSEIESRRGRGSALPTGVRRRMESAFGGDLGDVSIHTDDRAAQLSSAVSAKAFTTGKDIFFGAGQFDPSSAAGEHMLAHEIAHTRQQGSGVGRKAIHRVWDLKAKNLDLMRTRRVRALENRPIYFLADEAGDEIVVKSEDQPVGLGQVAGFMHKKMGSAKNVDQVKLSSGQRNDVEMLIDIADLGGSPDASFHARGKYLMSTEQGHDASADPYEVAFDDAKKYLRNKGRNLMAMGFAEGETGEKKAKQVVDDGNGGKISPLRGILEVLPHLKALGKLTATDLFVGNMDRAFNGNTGNWVYNPEGSLTVIDNVDGGEDKIMTSSMKDPSMWYGSTYGGYELQNSKIAETADHCLYTIAQMAVQTTPDTGILNWWRSKDDAALARRERGNAAFLEGLKEGKKEIVKTFSATRFSLGKGKARATKKAIKAEAQKANETDSDDGTMAGTGDYYSILKERALWLAKK